LHSALKHYNFITYNVVINEMSLHQFLEFSDTETE